MLSREYVHTSLQDGGYYEVLMGAANGAQDDWRELIAAKPKLMGGAIPRERSTFLNRRAVERICEALEGHPNVVITKRYGATIMTLNDEITLRFKKLNRRFRASNIRTIRVRDLWHRNQPLGGAFEDWINVTFGWRLDRGGMITDLAIVNEHGDRLAWIIRLTDEVVSEAEQVQTTFVGARDAEETPVFVVSLRDTNRAREVQDNASQKNKAAE